MGSLQRTKAVDSEVVLLGESVELGLQLYDLGMFLASVGRILFRLAGELLVRPFDLLLSELQLLSEGLYSELMSKSVCCQ